MQIKKPMLRLLFIFGIPLILISIFSIQFGAKSLSISEVLNILMGGEASKFNQQIIELRIYRTIFGILAGMALSTSGLLMQIVTHNSMADPSLLGVNMGAFLSIMLASYFLNVTSGIAYIVVAFLGGFLTAIVVYGFSNIGRQRATPIKLILVGTLVNMILSTFISILILMIPNFMDRYRFWQVGSIGGRDLADIFSFLPLVFSTILISILLVPSFEAMRFGDEKAQSLGLSPFALRTIAIMTSVLLASATTAFAGPIGFVGLVIPHLVKQFVGHSMKLMMLFTPLAGAIMLVFSDALGRVLGSPGEVDVGIMTGIIGGPLFIYFIYRSSHRVKNEVINHV